MKELFHKLTVTEEGAIVDCFDLLRGTKLFILPFLLLKDERNTNRTNLKNKLHKSNTHARKIESNKGICSVLANYEITKFMNTIGTHRARG